MKVAHVLGHNSNWNVDIHNQQGVGDYFIITAFTHGWNFDDKPLIKKIRSKALIDLQFYGKNAITKGGKLNEFHFHPCNQDDDEATNVYFINCVKQAIQFQINKKFDNIVIPLFYENDELSEIIRTIKEVNKYLSNISNIVLLEPMAYEDFIWLMNRARLIITDSGGVQEEAPSLGKPVLVMRNTTERPEAVEAGTVILVGTDAKKIKDECLYLLENTTRFEQMSKLHNPYGDGKACKRIVEFLRLCTV